MTIAVFNEKAPIFMRRLMSDFGFTAEDAAAIMGNAGHESGGLTLWQEQAPTVKGSRGGWGWFQWTGARRTEFEAWCARKGFGLKDDEAQYSFLYRELVGPERKAVAATKKAVGLEAKVRAFEGAYERAGVKHYDSRLTWAKRALAAFNSAPAVAPTAPVVEVKKTTTTTTVKTETPPVPANAPVQSTPEPEGKSMDLVWMLLRYGLIAAGTAVASKGYISEGDTQTLVGAVMALATAGWGIFVKSGTKAVPVATAARPDVPTVSAATGQVESGVNSG